MRPSLIISNGDLSEIDGIDTAKFTPVKAAHKIILYLEHEGFIGLNEEAA